VAPFAADGVVAMSDKMLLNPQNWRSNGDTGRTVLSLASVSLGRSEFLA